MPLHETLGLYDICIGTATRWAARPGRLALGINTNGFVSVSI